MSLLPRTTLGQIIAIIAAALVTTFGLSFALLYALSPLLPPRPVEPIDNALAVVQAIRLLDATSPDERIRLLPALSSDYLQIVLGPPPAACGPATGAAQAMADRLHELMPVRPGSFAVAACPVATGSRPEMQVVVPLEAGMADIHLRGIGTPSRIVLSIPFLVGLAFLILTATVLSVWAAWRVTRPLRRLARTAEAFGRDIVVAPLAEDGPRELRLVARAFNGMQEQVSAAIRDRTRMLAAIGHDLRTPLTRLKLRTQLEVGGEACARMLGDINQLQIMVGSALDFLQGQTAVEAQDRIDLAALLTTICDEYDEVGTAITCSAGLSLPCSCQPLAIRRAITNLIENARTYGTSVEVGLRRVGDDAVIEVVDNGPGIPDPLKADALQPFTRLDTTRATSRGNMGLGLAIVSDVARAHHGRLELANNQPRGLVARLILPARTR